LQISFCINTSFGTPSGTKFKIKIDMATSEFDLENVIPMTEANLRDEQKQAIAKAMENYKQQCLKSFSINRSGEVI